MTNKTFIPISDLSLTALTKISLIIKKLWRPFALYPVSQKVWGKSNNSTLGK